MVKHPLIGSKPPVRSKSSGVKTVSGVQIVKVVKAVRGVRNVGGSRRSARSKRPKRPKGRGQNGLRRPREARGRTSGPAPQQGATRAGPGPARRPPAPSLPRRGASGSGSGPRRPGPEMSEPGAGVRAGVLSRRWRSESVSESADRRSRGAVGVRNHHHPSQNREKVMGGGVGGNQSRICVSRLLKKKMRKTLPHVSQGAPARRASELSN